MRKYVLASKDARGTIDLREYRSVIEAAVHEIMPQATVVVMDHYYTVEPSPPQGSAVKIGRIICKSGLCTQCVYIPKLFSSTEEQPSEKEERNGKRKRNPHGGHQ